VRWAILEQLRKPSPGFDEAIKTHFKLKKDDIIKQCDDWVKYSDENSTNASHKTQLATIVNDIKKVSQYCVYFNAIIFIFVRRNFQSLGINIFDFIPMYLLMRIVIKLLG